MTTATVPPLVLDHLVVVAPSLSLGLAHVREALGMELPAGGAHPQMGTHNHLLRLGDDCYMEVIAIDPMATAPAHPRWFELDRLDDWQPYLATWVLGTPDIDAAVRAASHAVGPILNMRRDHLTWRLTVREDGGMPFDGAHPSFIQWPPGPHPATGMADLGCRLLRFVIEHPEAMFIQDQLGESLQDDRIEIRESDRKIITAEVETPNGDRIIS